MAGNVNGPRLWEGADLYTAPEATALPASLADAMSTAPLWKAVGLLSEDGASEARDEDSADYFAWGGKLVRTQRSRHKRTIQVTCLEDNLTVFGLVNPGSPTPTSLAGENKRTVKIPKSARASFVLELLDGAVHKRRHIPSGEVTEVGEVTLSESDLQAYALTITIYPDAEDVLYVDYDNDDENAV